MDGGIEMKCENVIDIKEVIKDVIKENNLLEPEIGTIHLKEDDEIKGTDALIMYLLEKVNELEHIVKEQERRIKLLESKNNDGWCNK